MRDSNAFTAATIGAIFFSSRSLLVPKTLLTIPSNISEFTGEGSGIQSSDSFDVRVGSHFEFEVVSRPPKLGGQHDRDAVEIVRGVVPTAAFFEKWFLWNHPGPHQELGATPPDFRRGLEED